MYIRAIQRHSEWTIMSSKLTELRTDSIHLSRDSNTRSILYSRSWIDDRRKGKWKNKMNNLLHSSWSFQQRYRWSTINYRFQETKKRKLSNSLETWTRCSVLDSFVHSTRYWSRVLTNKFWCHYYISVCVRRMRRKDCQRKWIERIVRKTAHHTPRTTKSNTQTIMVLWEIPKCKHVSGSESKLQTGNSDPKFIRETLLVERGVWTIYYSQNRRYP